MLEFSQFEYLTFDCYGTLINWEAGILAAVRPILTAHGVTLPDEDILRCYGEFESAAQSAGYRRYRMILEEVVHSFGRRFSFSPSAAAAESMPASLPSWPPFPDTVAALRQLHSVFKLAIISNVDNDLFAETAKQLEVPFDAVITAEQAGSYKPSHRNFELALQRIARPKEKVLHVAQSLFHDIAPARELGIKNVWVNRRGDKPGTGATKAALAVPDLEVLSLEALAALAVPR